MQKANRTLLTIFIKGFSFVFEYFFFALGGLLALILVYLWSLALVSLLKPNVEMEKASLLNRFVILIPAHNESSVIERTLDSLEKINYRADKYIAIVVADNCTDNTAEIAMKKGVLCYERKEPKKRGKGFALQWILEKITDKEYDAVVIIDADTLVALDFLDIMNKYLCNGEKAIQGYYDALNPEESPMSSLSYLGFVLSRNLRYKGRSKLGWSGNLLGNGMCFSRDVLEKIEWDGTSIVEDIEYEMRLVLHGLRVVFVPEAKVYAEIPNSFAGSENQRSRWDLGKFQVRNKYITKLLREGIRQKKAIFFDCAMELLIPPYSLFCASVLISFICMTIFFTDSFGSLFFLWLCVLISLVLYSLLGLTLAKASIKVYRNLIYVPFFLAWRIITVIKGYFFGAKKEWIKTQRKPVSPK